MNEKQGKPKRRRRSVSRSTLGLSEAGFSEPDNYDDDREKLEKVTGVSLRPPSPRGGLPEFEAGEESD